MAEYLERRETWGINLRFIVRDLLWFILALALALGWYVDQRQLMKRFDISEHQLLIQSDNLNFVRP